MTIRPIPALVLVSCTTVALAAQQGASPPLFRISTGDFWLNLHQYLYVLGRAELKTPDAGRRAVADVPADQARGLETLTPAERETWHESVRAYAAGPSRQDPVFDASLIAVGNALAAAGDRPALDGVAVDADIRATLERAAPIYRKGWWQAHRVSNDRWKQALESLLDEHAKALVAYLTRVYGMPWSSDGYPVHVVAFSNWAGAFSTTGPLLVIASTDSGNAGLSALETVVHESMHQWDERFWNLLREEAKAQGRALPEGLTHALIFFTAGEAVRSLVPDYTPYAVANGLWNRGIGRYKPALEQAWLPWLRGSGTRDDAIAALVKLAAGTQ